MKRDHRSVVQLRWASFINETEFTGEALTATLARASLIDFRPAVIMVSSSSEMLVLASSLGRQMLQMLREAFPSTRITVVALGCLGLHACIHEFDRLKLKTALILLWEIPSGLQQCGLDALGVGFEGLRAVGGIGILAIERNCPDEIEERGAVIGGCQIFSRKPGLSSLVDLAQQIKCYLGEVQNEEDAIVSFELPIGFSRRLLALLARALEGRTGPHTWLESSEVDGTHRLTIKPLVEIVRYSARISGVLTVLSLGGGGRVGCLRVGAASKSLWPAESKFLAASKLDYDSVMSWAPQLIELLSEGKINDEVGRMLLSRMFYFKYGRSGERDHYGYCSIAL